MQACLDDQWDVAKQIVADEPNNVSNHDELPKVFLNLPKAMHQGWDNKYVIGVGEGFFGSNHCNTKWLLNIMGDGGDCRLLRMLKQGRTRILFETDKYYQILDQPSLYLKGNALERSMFSSKAVLFMNSFGIAVYLRYYSALKVLSKQQKFRKPMIYYNQDNYAAYVNDVSCGDVMLFHYDYIILKREAYAAIPHLLAIRWAPGDPSKIVYRRRYYQYITPFLDWVDVCRNIIKRKPSLQLSKVSLQLIESRSPQFKLIDLKEMGQVMLEYFELKKLTSENFSDPNNFGMYAGRKLLNDKEPSMPSDYVKVFDHKPARPVIPHAVSAPRRFLSYTYYYDHENLTTLSQILSVTEVFQRNRYFCCDRHCTQALWHRDPLLFQIYEIINLQCLEDIDVDADAEKVKKVVLREQNWSDIASKPHMLCWFHRFDILNCLSLLFGILQNCLLKNFPAIIIDRICKILLDILISSEFIEPFLSFSFYDTFFGLTSLTNCVPGLQSSSVMRVMKKAPLMLTQFYSIPQISDMFSMSFWRKRDSANDDRPSTLDEVGDFLVTRKRLMSMRIMAGEGGEGMSCTSAMGSAGSIIMFARDYEKMTEVSQAEEEAVDTGKSDTIKKAQDEVLHIQRYTRQEIDFRYSSLFGQNFRYAVGRPKLVLDESKTLSQNEKESRDVPTKLP